MFAMAVALSTWLIGIGLVTWLCMPVYAGEVGAKFRDSESWRRGCKWGVFIWPFMLPLLVIFIVQDDLAILFNTLSGVSGWSVVWGILAGMWMLFWWRLILHAFSAAHSDAANGIIARRMNMRSQSTE